MADTVRLQKPKSCLPIAIMRLFCLGWDVPRAIGLPFDLELQDHVLCRTRCPAKVGLQRHRQSVWRLAFFKRVLASHIFVEGGRPTVSAFLFCRGSTAASHTPQHAGEVRVVEGHHLRAVAPPGRRCLSNSSTLFLQNRPAKPSLRSSHVGRLCLASAISVFTLLSEACVADHVARVARDHEAAGFLWFVVRDSCVERLFVCTSASSLIMMSSH